MTFQIFNYRIHLHLKAGAKRLHFKIMHPLYFLILRVKKKLKLAFAMSKSLIKKTFKHL